MSEHPVKPLAEVLLNGPIPADELQGIKSLGIYIEPLLAIKRTSEEIKFELWNC